MKNILVTVVSVFFLLSACKESKTKPKEKNTDDFRKGNSGSKAEQKNGSRDYTISAIKGWTRTDTVMMGQRVVFLQSTRENAEDDFIENVNVITEKVGDMDMEKYLDENISSMKKGLTSYVQGKISERSINGLDFRIMRYSHDYGGTPIDGEVYFTLDNNTAYIITCSAKGGTISRWEQEFDEIIRSFKLN